MGFDAFLNYKFKVRSIAGQPGNFTYYIEFESKKRNFIKGILKIQQDGWILEQSILEPHKTSLFDLDGLKITQKYIQSISGASLVNERYFDWYLKSDTGSIKVIHSDFILN